jgi:hypothetical protein
VEENSQMGKTPSTPIWQRREGEGEPVGILKEDVHGKVEN